jgi:ubiquinone biosynthesis protein
VTRFGNRVARYTEILKILAEEGILTGGRQSEPDADIAEGAPTDAPTADAAYAASVRRAFERLGPAFIKVGQILATRRDLIGPVLADELSHLKDDVPTLPFEEIREMAEESLGDSVDALYAEFDTEPIASASIAQVYAATTKSGQAVVVKIQRPGVTETMEIDLEIINGLASSLANHRDWAREAGVPDVVAGLTSIVRAELDYSREADSITKLREAFAEDEHAYFPEVFPELSGTRVLTIERLDGVPASDSKGLDEAGVDRREFVRHGVDTYLEQFFDIGFFHADPHEGNLFALSGGKVGFVDFGRMGQLTPREQDLTAQFVMALATHDAQAATDALVALTRPPIGFPTLDLQRQIERVMDAYSRAASEGESGLGGAFNAILDVMLLFRLRMPANVILLMTTVGILDGVARSLSPGFDVLAAVKQRADTLGSDMLEPDFMKSTMLRMVQRYWRLFDELPVTVTRTLRRASDGEFQVAVRPVDYDPLLDRIEALVNRLAFAIIAAAFIGSWTLLVVSRSRDEWALAAASVITLLSLVALVIWWWRSRVERQQRQAEQKRRERMR